MQKTYKAVQVGVGGFGSYWVSHFLPPTLKDGRVEMVGVADVNPEALERARESYGLPREACFPGAAAMLDAVKADFCIVVVPPAHHEAVVAKAVSRGMDILSEKPIADSLEASVRVADLVRREGRIMGVTMSHRFDQDKTTLREILRSGRHGPLDYLVMRFTYGCRKFASWGKFRHEIPDPLLVEGAVHHLDILADMAGEKCDTLYAQTWNPKWGEYAGDSQALVTMHMANGVRAMYEGAKSNAVCLNGWSEEYIRAECEGATIILDRRAIRVHPHEGSDEERQQGIAVPLLEQPYWSNAWLVRKFVDWLDGGPPMETNVEDNLQSVALVFSGVRSSRTGQPVQVQEYLEQTRSSCSLSHP